MVPDGTLDNIFNEGYLEKLTKIKNTIYLKLNIFWKTIFY